MALLVSIWREWLREAELAVEAAPEPIAEPPAVIEAEPAGDAGPAKATIGLKT
jgi:hypothetical protein